MWKRHRPCWRSRKAPARTGPLAKRLPAELKLLPVSKTESQIRSILCEHIQVFCLTAQDSGLKKKRARVQHERCALVSSVCSTDSVRNFCAAASWSSRIHVIYPACTTNFYLQDTTKKIFGAVVRLSNIKHDCGNPDRTRHRSDFEETHGPWVP